jgi:hypothetical protein
MMARNRKNRFNVLKMHMNEFFNCLSMAFNAGVICRTECTSDSDVSESSVIKFSQEIELDFGYYYCIPIGIGILRAATEVSEIISSSEQQKKKEFCQVFLLKSTEKKSYLRLEDPFSFNFRFFVGWEEI